MNFDNQTPDDMGTATNIERINEANWIIGSGTKNGVSRSFVLSPR